MIRRIARRIWLQDKRLEEPGSMRQVPFRWTHARHRLDHIVLNGEGLAERMGPMAYIEIIVLYVRALHGTPPCANLSVQSTLPSASLRHGRQNTTTEQIGKTYIWILGHWPHVTEL